MTTALLTPLDLAEATKVGRRTYRKQILPLTTIDYKGQKITFDEAYIKDLAEAFRSGAYDQVPVQFATDKNEHNENPRNFGGEIKAVEATPTGLDAIIELTEDADAAVAKNPRLGVSARIREGLAKSDGRTFARALRHVLLTMDARTTTGPWQAVDLSAEDDTEVVDLTAATYEEDAVAKATVDKDKKKFTTADGKEIDLATMSDDDFTALLDLTATAVEAGVEEDAAATDSTEEPKEGEIFEEDGKQYVILEGVKMLLTPAEKPEGEQAPVAPASPDLSNEVIDKEARSEVQQMRLDLAADRFEAERKDLLRAGVPRAVIDLAEPLLKTAAPVTIDLSNSEGNETVNATKVVRDLLDQYKGFVDLHPEIGHQVDLSEDEGDHKSDADLLAEAWEREYGAV